MQNRFRPYNKSLLVNVFISKEYKLICDKYYIPKYDDVNEKYNDWTPLIYVSGRNMINTTRLLLSNPNIDVNIKSTQGNTTLIFACNNRQTKMVKLLLSHPDIDANIKNGMQCNALYYAMLRNNQTIVNLLEQHNAK